MKDFLLPTKPKFLVGISLVLYILINYVILSTGNCSRCLPSESHPIKQILNPIVFAPTKLLLAPMYISNLKVFKEPYAEFYTSKSEHITVNDPNDAANLISEIRYRTTKEGKTTALIVEIIFLYLLASVIVHLNKKIVWRKK